MGNNISEEKNLQVKKFVTVNNVEVLKTNPVSNHTKLQKKIAKWFKLELAELNQYAFRITYKGSHKLKINDIVSTTDGEILAVMRSEANIAVLATSEGYKRKPKVYGRLYILPTEKLKNNL